VQTGMPQPLTDGGVHRGCTVARNLHVHMHDVTWSTCRPAAAIAGHNVTRPYFAPMLQPSTPLPSFNMLCMSLLPLPSST
jgi:hypothetical protein